MCDSMMMIVIMIVMIVIRHLHKYGQTAKPKPSWSYRNDEALPYKAV
ncbi:MAG: hypothetical protein IBX68_10400 [Dehalococcoidia bacterium]|nr:hypothetical protein [Dehalococcoidia bacterium]